MIDEGLKAEAKKEALKELIAMMQSMMVGEDTAEDMAEGEPASMEESEMAGAPEEEMMPEDGMSIEELAKKEMKKGSKIPSKGKSKMVIGVSVKSTPKPESMPFGKKKKMRY